MNRIPLAPNELNTRLDALNSELVDPWQIVDQKLHKKIVLKNFVQAIGFMTQVAIIAESMNHHPQWSNIYKSVDINLTTHSSNGITELDFKLAAEIEKILR